MPSLSNLHLPIFIFSSSPSEKENKCLPHHECQIVGEDDNHSSSGAAAQKLNSSGDGATIEVVRWPRCPPGSKNRPRPPVIITRDPEPSMSPFILEVSVGNDFVQAVAEFSHRRNIGLCVLTAS
ncbi:unnamed protein product [Vicia faba]|uniref:PPC domain-containing protein n=1 Tax=Vicia faba TaxID=3906 RepID=A0AAV0YMN2_VICFA|nr:unnamed protein product [Vicia faba]